MGSAIGTCEEVVEELLARGEKVGVLKVRLFRPFSAKHLLAPCRKPYAASPFWIAPKSRAPG
jgi:pyruvate-ferredoxin/flavodoxin oxidoreductase